jgi:hypothetical protein
MANLSELHSIAMPGVILEGTGFASKVAPSGNRWLYWNFTNPFESAAGESGIPACNR